MSTSDSLHNELQEREMQIDLPLHSSPISNSFKKNLILLYLDSYDGLVKFHSYQQLCFLLIGCFFSFWWCFFIFDFLFSLPPFFATFVSWQDFKKILNKNK